MKGRKPKPTHLRLITGNPGKRPLNNREPQLKAARPRPPEFLGEIALKEWRRVAPLLGRSGVLTQADRAALAIYCQAYERMVHAEAMMAKFGVLVKTPNDHLAQSPWLAIANRSIEQIRQFAIEFGMTPSSRSRVSAAPGAAGEDDPAEKYFG